MVRSGEAERLRVQGGRKEAQRRFRGGLNEHHGDAELAAGDFEGLRESEVRVQGVVAQLLRRGEEEMRREVRRR